jgi:SPX domain protein involved in polyphosphate accumulation
MKAQDWRYEVKYILKQEEWAQLQQVLISHPASFYSAYPDRLINNIYLDTTDFVTCQDNLAGISERRKYRIRWYGDEKVVENPILEIKIKNNALGRKEFHPIEDWSDEYLYKRQIQNHGQLNPVLQNQYLRSYYLNWQGNFRLTVDRAIKYKRADDYLSSDLSGALLDEHIIVELKFKEEDLKFQKEISHYLPFRTSKHSKYVTGIFYCFS